MGKKIRPAQATDQSTVTRMNKDRKNLTLGPASIAAITIVWLLGMSPAQAIAQDIVYQFREGKNPARVRGTIEQVSPQEVTIETESNGKQTIPETLDKMKDDPAGQKWQPEADYLRAAVNAQLSLSGGSVTAQDAGKQVNQFLVTHPESYLKFPAMEQLGKLLFAFGRMKNASQSFEQLTQSGWPRLQRIGSYWQGLSQRELGNFEGAIGLFKQLGAIQAGDPELETWQLMAACQVARCEGESGDTDAAVAKLRKIIKEQNPDNARLFATAFNSLGALYMKQNKLKEARTEFLKTELLYPTAVNEHAEALYYLTKIWAELNENDRAIQARETLKNLYANSWWVTRK